MPTLSQWSTVTQNGDARGDDSRDAGLYESGAGARQAGRQTHGHLGVRVRPLRDVDGQRGVSRRHGLGHDCQDSRARTGLGCVACRDTTERSATAVSMLCAKTRSTGCAMSATRGPNSSDSVSLSSICSQEWLNAFLPRPLRRRRRLLPWLAATLAMLAVVILVELYFRQAPPVAVRQPVVRLALPVTTAAPLTTEVPIVLSPDGKQVVYRSRWQSRTSLHPTAGWIRSQATCRGRGRLRSLLLARRTTGGVRY